MFLVYIQYNEYQAIKTASFYKVCLTWFCYIAVHQHVEVVSLADNE